MKRETISVVAVAVVLMLVGFLSFQWGHATTTRVAEEQNPTVRELGADYTYIKPLLVCDNRRDLAADQYNALREKLEAYIKTKKSSGEVDDVSVYFRDLSSGAWTGIKQDKTFDPASLLKVPIMITAYRQTDLESDILTRAVHVPVDVNIDPQTTPPSQVVENGETYTVDELIRYMIQYSDNRAKDLLYQQVDQTVLASVLLDLGITNLFRPEGRYSISPRSFSLFLRILYNSTYLSREKSEQALTYLANSDFDDGLAAGLPESTVIANKFGEFGETATTRELHDCGIIYSPSKDYVLCVMTRGNSVPKLKETIAGLSKLVYETVFP